RSSVSRAEGGVIVANQPVEASILVDDVLRDVRGQPANQSLQFQTDAAGNVEVRFRLPETIKSGDALLSLKFHDGPVAESLPRALPLVLKHLNVEFFPEGGELVAGVPNRVYFQARTPLHKPADFRGHVVDDRGRTVVSEVQTLHDDTVPQ